MADSIMPHSLKCAGWSLPARRVGQLAACARASDCQFFASGGNGFFDSPAACATGHAENCQVPGSETVKRQVSRLPQPLPQYEWSKLGESITHGSGCITLIANAPVAKLDDVTISPQKDQLVMKRVHIAC